MKKLALALVCFASVAFFASCNPVVDNPEPTIAIMTGENFITGTVDNPTIIDAYDETNYQYGFHVESNAQTKKELAELKVHYELIDAQGTRTYDSIIDLTGKTAFDFQDCLYEEEDTRTIVTEFNIQATVTDVDGKTNTATIAMKFDLTAQPLIARTFEWYRLGNTITGLEEFGLWWDRNLKATHAQIKPLDGAKLFIFDAEDWEAIATDVDKAALFNAAIENGQAVSLYDGINTDVAGDKDYDDVIGSITADGTMYLIHITHYFRGTFVSQGYPYTITGEAK